MFIVDSHNLKDLIIILFPIFYNSSHCYESNDELANKGQSQIAEVAIFCLLNKS
jgi:hypothetical protein